MKSLINLSDTRITVALLALGMVCLTVLAAMGKMDPESAGTHMMALLAGGAVAWNRGSALPVEPKQE